MTLGDFGHRGSSVFSPLPEVLLALDSGIGLFLIRQTGKIIHAGIQRHGYAAALFKREIPPPGLDLGIVALVDPGQELHLHLRETALLSELFQSCHIHHQ